MMCYPPSGYIIFSLRKLKFCGDRGMRAEGRGPGAGQPIDPKTTSLLRLTQKAYAF